MKLRIKRKLLGSRVPPHQIVLFGLAVLGPFLFLGAIVFFGR